MSGRSGFRFVKFQTLGTNKVTNVTSIKSNVADCKIAFSSIPFNTRIDLRSSSDLSCFDRSILFTGQQNMGLWTLLEGCLLIANALAILNEDRFLAPRGWSFQEYSGVKRNSFKGQIIGLIYATQYLRVLLIMLNSLCIVVKLVSG
ncbi:hypothetical protein QVD17_23543 [Tagetes erecta]|uniref:Yos1-like protein n=1 Tax=Tagetes erecta TaxID=13708 RepID=A0AAD8NU77_TARER|nr:hypothetical protein QVD17_23543 [Tagetes erecta]